MVVYSDKGLTYGVIDPAASGQRSSSNNPYTQSDYESAYPDRTADEWLEMYPATAGGFNFITNADGYESWTENINPVTEEGFRRWTLATNPEEIPEIVEAYPADRSVKQKYHLAYDNKTNEFIPNGIGTDKSHIKGVEGVKGIEVTVEIGPDGKDIITDENGNTYTGFTDFFQNGGAIGRDGNIVKGGNESGIKASLQTNRDELQANHSANEKDLEDRINGEFGLNEWNTNNVWIPATEYAEKISTEGKEYREKAAQTWNDTLPEQRQELADNANALGDLVYTQASALNNWNKGVVDWANNSQTGTYTSNRSHIYDRWGTELADIANSLNNQAGALGLEPVITEEAYESMVTGAKNAYGAYYGAERVPMWNGDTDGGTYDLVGNFDADYYLQTQNTGLTSRWNDALLDTSDLYNPNNDLDVTARWGSLANMAWGDYSTSGKSQGLRGSAAEYAKEAEEYDESYANLTDEQRSIIRDQVFGLTAEDEDGKTSIEWAENILDPLTDETRSLLEEKVGTVFSESDLEIQDKFRGLAQDVLEKSVAELTKQQEKERELDVYRSLPGFNEIFNSSATLANNLLGDMGGYLNMMGINSRDVASDLEDQIEGMTGINNANNAEFNWDKWMNETLTPYYEGLEEIEGERLDEEGNKIVYQMTDEEGKAFISKFIGEYITPRFNMSKSMSEFVSYLDTLDEDQQNIFQTQTAMNALKQQAEVNARSYFNSLANNSDLGKFDAEFYFNPLASLNGVPEEDLERDYMNVAQQRQKYQDQTIAVNADWEDAKSNPDSKSGIPEDSLANAYTWQQWAYKYGVDIQDKAQFAKLHYQVVGQGKYDPAKDVFDIKTINTYMDDVLLPLIREEKISMDDAAFMKFVTPEEFASAMLEGIDPLENKEEWKEVLETFGIEDLDAGLDEVKEYIKEVFETGAAQDIREGIKYLNEKKEDIDQEALGVDYIQRDPLEILGERGDIEVGSEAWKDLMISYNFSQDLTYDEAVRAIADKEDIDEETYNPLYEYFRADGYQGTEDEFVNEFFPDATSDDLADLNFVGRALQGGFSGTDIDMSDPFMAMSQFDSLLGSSDSDLYGINTEDDDYDEDLDSDYFDIFPDERDYASSTGRGIIDSWTGGLFG